MNIQAKVALDKEKHPERFCKAPRCLWRVVKLDHATQTFSPLPNCPNGLCPRHQPADALRASRDTAAIAAANDRMKGGQS